MNSKPEEPLHGPPGTRWPGMKDGAALTSDLTIGERINVADRVHQVQTGAPAGIRTNLAISAIIDELERGLRKAATTRAQRAAVTLIRSTGWLHQAQGWHLGTFVQARDPDNDERHLNWTTAAEQADQFADNPSKAAVLRIAASLAGGASVNLDSELAVLTGADRRAVRLAFKSATRRPRMRLRGAAR